MAHSFIGLFLVLQERNQRPFCSGSKVQQFDQRKALEIHLVLVVVLWLQMFDVPSQSPSYCSQHMSIK